MTQELIAAKEMQAITIDEARRAWYNDQLAKFKNEGPKILAGIKNEEGVTKASAWRVEIREFIRTVEAGALGTASAWLHKRKKEIDADINSYIDPCDKLFKEAKVKMDRWYLDEAERVRIANEKAKAKVVAKAEEKQAQQVQTLMDLGKPKQAMVAAQKPLPVHLPKIPMPDIKHAVWKKKYIVQIDDLSTLLAYIAKKPQYHKLIDQEKLIGRLEGLAVDLAGNMAEFKGARCFETPTSVSVGGPK